MATTTRQWAEHMSRNADLAVSYLGDSTFETTSNLDGFDEMRRDFEAAYRRDHSSFTHDLSAIPLRQDARQPLPTSIAGLVAELSCQTRLLCEALDVGNDLEALMRLGFIDKLRAGTRIYFDSPAPSCEPPQAFTILSG